jgi:hypothetical protein
VADCHFSARSVPQLCIRGAAKIYRPTIKRVAPLELRQPLPFLARLGVVNSSHTQITRIFPRPLLLPLQVPEHVP